jgi:hypothetical protein
MQRMHNAKHALGQRLKLFMANKTTQPLSNELAQLQFVSSDLH